MKIPESLSSAKRFLEQVSNNKNTNSQNDILEIINYFISNPNEIVSNLLPFGMAILMVMIILKIIGFKTEKWIVITFIILLLITVIL